MITPYKTDNTQPSTLSSTQSEKRCCDMVRTTDDDHLEWYAALNALEDAVFWHDEGYRIIQANQAYADLVDLPMPRLVGRPYWESLPCGDGPLPGCTDALTCSGSAESEIDLPDGRILQNRSFSMRDPNGRHLYSIHVLRDITEHKHAEQRLRDSEERYHTLFESMREGFALHEVIVDGQGRAYDYRFLDVNSAFEEQTGFSRDAILGRTVREVLPAVEDHWIATYGKVALTGEATHFESFSRELDRHYDIIAFSPRRGQFATVFNDVTPLRQAVRDLERSNRALRTLSAVNHVLIEATDERALLQEMCRVAVELGGYRMAWVGYAEHEQDREVVPVAQAGVDADYLRGLNISWADIDEGHCPTGAAIYSGERQVARRLQSDPRYRAWHQVSRERNINSAVSIPLAIDTEVFGALSIYAEEPDAFDQQEIALLQEMAEDLAFGIDAIRTRIKHDEAEATIHRMAYYDSLTDLPNHISLEEQLQQSLAQAQAGNHSLALLLLDLNRFREVNDTLGFNAGNLLLKEIGQRIKQVLGEGELIARMRGDEFAVLLDKGDADKAKQAVYRILGAMEDPFQVGNLALDMRISVGITLFPGHGNEAADLIRRADVAMQQAKATGNPYALYSPQQDEDKPRRLALAGDLRRALENNELRLHYQPKICMNSGRISGLEALLRWQHPVHGMIPPDEFVVLAENTGMIRALTDWVMEAALRQSNAWHHAGIRLPIAVNLSTRNLQDPQLLDKIEGLYATWCIEQGMLELEITESAVMQDPAGALEVLKRLDDLGIPLFIDDFGTGYSSLGYLKKLPVSAMKIDKSFVMDMLQDKDSATIVRSTITLAHDLDLKVVAEGVEDKMAWEQLAALGCDVGQGYYMGRPQPADQLEQWLQESPWGLQQAPSNEAAMSETTVS